MNVNALYTSDFEWIWGYKTNNNNNNQETQMKYVIKNHFAVYVCVCVCLPSVLGTQSIKWLCAVENEINVNHLTVNSEQK